MQTALSHYRIIEEIGAGGMGIVYRAHDERLDRDVALKVLPTGSLADEAQRKRFRKEAHALSKLNHANIATLFDFDDDEETAFLIEELIPGHSLSHMLISGPLPEHEVIHLGSQLVDGLAAAHEANVIHCDLKPGNIVVTPDARLKILDFGLARMIRPSVATDMQTTASLSDTQRVSGTPAYMAPEQLLNVKLDARTDIWAVGCVLYEMVTGQHPFLGSGTILSDAILHQPAPPPSTLNSKVSSGLEAVILKCLEKDPRLRYCSAREVAVDLRRLSGGSTLVTNRTNRHAVTRRLAAAGVAIVILIACAYYFARHWSAPAAAPIHSVVVLPFENLSGNVEQQPLADGMTDALIAELATIRSLKVISRTSAMQYRGVRKPLSTIGRELGVEGVIEGAILREGKRVRVTVRLCQASTERNLWADRYDRDMPSVLALQSEIAGAIATKMQSGTTATEMNQLARIRTVNPEAYEAYLRGRYLQDSMRPEKMKESAAEFRRAIALDPSFALPYAWLIEVDENAGREFALKAVQLDPDLAEAHIALARTSGMRNWSTQEREYKRALELKPGDITVLDMYAGYYLSFVGRLDEAIAMLSRVIELDPLSAMARARLARRLFFARRYDEAIKQFRIALQMKPEETWIHEQIGRIYLFKGMTKEGLAELKIWGSPELMAHGYCLAGNRPEAMKVLAQHKAEWARETPGTLAIVYGACGDKEEAFRWLEQAYKIQEGYMAHLKVSPVFDPLRSDPRFDDLLRRMNFPQ